MHAQQGLGNAFPVCRQKMKIAESISLAKAFTDIILNIKNEHNNLHTFHRYF